MRPYPAFFLFPQTIALRSPLPPARVEEILREHTDDRRIPLFSRKRFHGKVGEGQLSLTRISHGRNSFKPVISGRIEADVLGGSRMELTFRLHTFVYLFLLVWLPPWFLVPLGGLVAAATGKPEGLGLFFLPVVVALLAAVFHWAFSSEAGKAIAVLGGLVQAEPIRA